MRNLYCNDPVLDIVTKENGCEFQHQLSPCFIEQFWKEGRKLKKGRKVLPPVIFKCIQTKRKAKGPCVYFGES